MPYVSHVTSSLVVCRLKFSTRLSLPYLVKHAYQSHTTYCNYSPIAELQFSPSSSYPLSSLGSGNFNLCRLLTPQNIIPKFIILITD
jgi:hypothetical protein